MQSALIIPDGITCCSVTSLKITIVMHCHRSHPIKGSYHCNCEDGYDGNGFTSCNLMDECSTVTCGAYAHCEIVFDDTPNASNTINDAECVCDNGFVDSPSPYIRCIKVRSE